MFISKRYRDDSSHLEGIQLRLDPDKGYYLSVTYICENDKEKYRLSIPEIRLPINLDNVTITCERDCFNSLTYYTANLGFGDLTIRPNKDGVYYTETTLEEKVHEMTISDIEKKLGYKIKIVNEKE